jgi:hypothetical protein
MKKRDYFRPNELAKQSLMVYEIREYLRSYNIELPSPEIDPKVLEKISNTNFISEKILLPYQLILSLHNFKSTVEVNQFKNLDLPAMIEWIKLWDHKIGRSRGYDFSLMVEKILDDSITPPLLLLTYGKITVIDGRTRLLVSYAAKKDIYCDIYKNVR